VLSLRLVSYKSLGQAYQGYIERRFFRSAARPGVRTQAWEHAGITVDEPHVFGCFVDGHLAAAARYRPAWGETAHIGVVTHPADRRRHYGSAVVSAATTQALDAGFIVLYQTLLANAPSVALATGLGYQAYASHLAIRLTSDGA